LYQPFQESGVYFMSTACGRPQGGGGGSGPCGRMWTEGSGSKTRFFCGRHQWMTPYRALPLINVF